MQKCLSFVLLFILVGASLAIAQAPLPPANLSVHEGLFGGAALHWDSSSGAGGYRVYKSVNTSPFFPIGVTERVEFVDWAVYPGFLYSYYVTAFNLSGEGSQSEIVSFRLDHPPIPPVHGIIRGHVLDNSTNQPLQGAEVQFFDLHHYSKSQTHTDSNGAYSAPLDTGRYFVLASKFDYEPQWYNHASRLDSAWVVDLHQDSVTADFSLRELPHFGPVNVSGTVTDTVSGLPVRNAFVALLRPFHDLRVLERFTGLFGGFPFERLELPELGFLHGVVWMGLTDTDGNYTAHVPGGLRYIAMAAKPGYLPKFFRDKKTPLEADRLFLTNDTSGIDFALLRNPIATGSVSGTVSDSTGVGIPSHVILLRRLPHALLPVRYRMTDSVGGYQFSNLLAGNYLLKAVPVVDYAPAWYSASRCGVLNWHNADTIQVSNNVDVAGIDVCVRPASGGGFAMIAGQITQPPGSQFAKSTGIKAATPAGGVTVYAVQTGTNTVVGSDVTEDDGSYSIENLPPGSYDIVVDKEGFVAGTAPTYTVDSSNGYEVSGASVGISPDVTLGVAANPRLLPREYRLDQNFPNPFNPTTSLRFELPGKSLVTVRVYNLIGQQVAVLVDGTLEAGVYRAQWNAQDESGRGVGSGVYLVKLAASPVAGDKASFTQVRKMIFLK